MSFLATIDLRNHLENHLIWIVGMAKTLIKDTFVSPHPQVPACYHKNSLSILIVCSRYVIKDPVPARQRQRKEVSNIFRSH
jgi:hypothetical protein